MKTLNTLMVLLTLSVMSISAQSDYFQQEVNYTIDVKLNDKSNTLSAFQTIEYTNNSQKDLEELYFHLWPNAYKNNTTELSRELAGGKVNNKTFSNYEETGFIDSLDFKVNNKQVKWTLDKENIDICKIILNSTLKHGEKITITTPFFVKIPASSFSRFGNSQNTYQITQWYPKPAVYDKEGWHTMPYRNMGEFYSEFGSFDVTITLPADYVVGATGNLQTKTEQEFLNSRATKSKQMIDSLGTNMSYENFKKITSSDRKGLKKIRYTEKNIHDFAWFADKDYAVLKGDVRLPNSGKSVTTWAMFTHGGLNNWVNSIEYINDALSYYSKWYGDYAYNNCTAVEGRLSAGAGMEYPTITVIGNSQSKFSHEVVIMHEVGHNWFYGMLGFNERDYPYLDEGLNTFSEIRYIESKYPNSKMINMITGDPKKQKLFNKLLRLKGFQYRDYHRLMYLYTARKNIDQPTNLESKEFSMINYGSMAYSKAGLSFLWLKDFLGEENFNKTMRQFFKKWQFKHPQPKDLEKALTASTNKDLSWFFNDVIGTTKKSDYKICGTKKNSIKIKNIGDINSPFEIKSILNGKTNYTLWCDGFEGSKHFELPETLSYDKLTINGNYLDLHSNNNSIKKKGIFKKCNPTKLNLLGIFEGKNENRINYIPTYAWNSVNSNMLGLTLYSNFIPRDNLRYRVTSLYTFGNNDFAGTADIKYRWNPYNSIFKKIDLDLNVKRFGYEEQTVKDDLIDLSYEKYSASLNFIFNKQNSIIIKNTYATNIFESLKSEKDGFNNFVDVTYRYKKSFDNNIFNIKANIEHNNKFVKSSIETSIKHTFENKHKIWLRFFGGKFLSKEDNLSSRYNFSLAGTSPYTDYKFDNYFFDRSIPNNNDMSHQIVENQGMFTFTDINNIGSSNDWLVAANIKFTLPYLKSLQGYANVGTFADAKNKTTIDEISYEAGIEWPIANRIMVIHFPLFMSKKLEERVDNYSSEYHKRIRFTFNLNKTLEIIDSL